MESLSEAYGCTEQHESESSGSVDSHDKAMSSTRANILAALELDTPLLEEDHHRVPEYCPLYKHGGETVFCLI